MAKVMFLLCALALINASTLTVASQDALAWATGFITGVEANPAAPTQCATDLIQAITEADTLLNDISSLLEGKTGAFTQLVLDLQQAKPGFDPLFAQCNFSELEKQLSILLSIQGVDFVIKNYFNNIKLISESIENYQECSDYNTCGLYAGQIVHYILDWSLAVTEVKSETFSSSSQDALLLLHGLLTGLQANPTASSECFTSLSNVLTNSDTLLVDVEDILSGSYSSVMKLLNDYKKFNNQLPTALIEICNIDGLINEIQTLLGPNGSSIAMMNYFKNKSAINADISSLTDCTANFSLCGQSAGQIVRLITGWSI
jgi:hypothetical protein